ncbi:MAG: hypothetical protein NAOJABEB_03290 [Steroidobacteraceae bacterium]|nr:hypothetical protein [Steroidobacteraceae bacterium]
MIVFAVLLALCVGLALLDNERLMGMRDNDRGSGNGE